MNTAIKKLVEGLEEMNEVLESLHDRVSKLESLSIGVPDSAEPVENVKPTEEPAEEMEEMVEVTAPKYEAEELEAMKYNELKALCKEEDLKASGKKDELISRLLEIGLPAKIPASELSEEVIEEPEIEETEVEDVSEDEEIEEVEEEPSNLYEKVEKAVEGYSNEEIADVLEEIGVSPKGKRQALLAKLVLAVENGDIELDLDEEESEDVEEPTEEGNDESQEVEEVEEEETMEDYVDGILENSTTKRKKEAKKLFNDIVEQYESEELTDKDIRQQLDEIYDNPKVAKGIELESYITLAVNLVDDDGEIHEMEEPYVLEGQNACCGEHLKELENGNLFCEVCGIEYEVE